MALAKKGSRTISVADKAYRWTVSPDSGRMVIVVEAREQPGQRIAVSVPYDDGVVPPARGAMVLRQNVVTPALVRRSILSALSCGWTPDEPGPELRTQVEGSDLLRWSHDWL